jgi:hypothetical protein
VSWDPSSCSTTHISCGRAHPRSLPHRGIVVAHGSRESLRSVARLSTAVNVKRSRAWLPVAAVAATNTKLRVRFLALTP